MFGKNCGTKLDDGLNFCTQCGTAVGKTPLQAEQYVGQPYRRLAVRKLVRERDKNRSLKWFLAASALAIALVVLFVDCTTTTVPDKPYWELTAKDRMREMKKREAKKQAPSKPVEVQEETPEERARRLDRQERQAAARYNGDARPIQQPIEQTKPVTPEQVTQAEPAWKTRLREFQQATGHITDDYGDNDTYGASVPAPVIDRSAPVYDIPLVKPRDMNTDGVVDCNDYAYAFYLRWGELHGFDGISLIYNDDTAPGHGAHMFDMVYGKPWDYQRQEYLQEGKVYGPDIHTGKYWVYHSKNNRVESLYQRNWWGTYDGKGY
jgi:hypothetical protein